MYEQVEKPLDRLVGGYSRTAIFRTVAFIGDSLSSGEFEVKNHEGEMKYYDLYEYSWGQFMARKNGFKAYNFSRGGMTARSYVENFATPKGLWDKELACQAYVITLGVNDLCSEKRKIDLGSIDDIDSSNYKNNAETFAGYYAQIISRYKEISPEAKFFLVGLPYDSSEEHAIKRAREMTSLLYDFAKHFDNTYVIDLHQYGPKFDDEFSKANRLNWHLSPVGYIYFAELIDSYIDYIIRTNPDDFKYVGLINSGLDYVIE